MDKGSRLGDFVLQAPIGVGAQGKVWRATHSETGDDAAVKIVGRHYAGRTHAWAAELNALARLDHPNIARVHDYGLVDDRTDEHLDGAAWIAMEFVAWPFAKVTDRLRDWDTARQVLDALLDGLAHAHARGVIHRDLKPGNLLVGGRDPQPHLVKLVDFGIAITDGAALRRARGTPAYMAPEQFTTEPSRLGPWTDLYSVAITLWKIVTGMRPFPRMGPAQLLERKLALKLEPFLPRFDIPDGLEGLIRRAMHPDVGSRFLCVADFRAALDALGSPAIPGSASALPDQTQLPTVPAQEGQPLLSAIDPLAPFPAASRPETWLPTPIRPWRHGAALAALRETPFVGREGARDALWSRLVPGARVHLTGPGADDLARWAAYQLREASGQIVISVRGHPDDAPGAALLRMLDEAIGFSASARPREAALEGLERYRANFRAAEYAVKTLLGGRSQTSVVRHGAITRIFEALCRQRGLVLLAATPHLDRDLTALLGRLERAIPDLQLVTTGGEWDFETLEVPPPAMEDAVEVITGVNAIDKAEARALLEAHDLDLARALGPTEPLSDLLPSERASVEYAAVLGTVERSVWADIITLTPGSLMGLEDDLVRRGIARRRPGGWVFRDETLREALLDDLRDTERHEPAAAAAADAMDARDDDPLRRGKLWLASGKPERAIRCWLAGADRIEDHHGRRASVDLWGYAHVVAHELPLSPDIHGEIDTRYLTGMVMLMDRREEAATLADAQRSTFEERGWNRQAALCCWVLATAYGVKRADEALTAIREGLALIEGDDDARDVAGRLWGNRFRLSHERATGEHLDDLRRAAACLKDLPDARSRLLYRRFAGMVAQMTGDIEVAVIHFAHQVEIARHERPTALPESITQHAVALNMAGRGVDAERLLDEALELATFAESAHQAAYASINLMTLALKRDDFGKGAEMAARTLAYARYSPHAALACHLGLALCAVGLADSKADEAWDTARKGLVEDHAPESDFVDMLERIAALAHEPMRTEAADLARLERARLDAEQSSYTD